ncbi:unnamed protein product [Adineta steineri]|uniref:Uncharacterized protein n=1 Tax=Adineta steineri TaxID=433720 RepID=A0A815HUW7_9BILA|nr:unnamed protein product [Adineta steineri]CAF1365504.1 unnamed protein product [Adineta steineri]
MNTSEWSTTDPFATSIHQRYPMRHQAGNGYVKNLIEKGLQKWSDAAERYANEKMYTPYAYNYNGGYGGYIR